MPDQLPTVRVGIAGLGLAGTAMLPALVKHPHIEITAAANRSGHHLSAFARDFQAGTYRTIEDLCKSASIDAIYIATPTQLHKEHVLMAAAYRKHILVEKPLCITLEDADDMIAAVERNGVQMVVGHSHSFDPPIRKMREIVRSGILGRVRMINSWYFTDWLYRPRLPEELDTRQGGGVTIRQGAHQFDIIRYLGGGLIRSVRAVTGAWDRTRPTEGSHVAFLEFEDETAATAVYSGYDHFHSMELTGIGEAGEVARPGPYASARMALRRAAPGNGEATLKRAVGFAGEQERALEGQGHQPFFGLLIVSCEHGDLRQSADGVLVYGDERKWEVPLSPDETPRDAVVAEFYDAILRGRPTVHNGRWAKATLEVCLAVLNSAHERREIMLAHQTAVLNETS
jgi:phthalate 4,5-cis-dihydrodiol dehydrogenase